MSQNENEIVTIKNKPLEVVKDDIQKLVDATDQMIENGLKKETASTGTPMDQLHGGSKIMAEISNIRGGSLSSGGGGVEQGLNIIQVNNAVKGVLAGMEISEKNDGNLMVDKDDSQKIIEENEDET